MEISRPIKRMFIWLVVALLLQACSEKVPELKVKEENGKFYVDLNNSSHRRMEIVGGAKLGIPPNFESIQWHVSSGERALGQCAFADADIEPVYIDPGKSRRMSLKKSILERVFCVPDGDYTVRVSYVHGEESVYSNEIRVKNER
ncbi:hypothetical protein M8R20_26755 [Pseudomonas sp. R2.Fl]|nr:hypothetical protein [Pseudomonas sp. R2.Fl]